MVEITNSSLQVVLILMETTKELNEDNRRFPNEIKPGYQSNTSQKSIQLLSPFSPCDVGLCVTERTHP
jgi:hypothetical protein